MTVAWPGTLPTDPLLAGYTEAALTKKASFESDTGPPIERPKGTVRQQQIKLAMDMTTAQVAIFEDFVFEDLAQASLDFTIDHPRTGNTITVRLAGGDEPYTIRPMSPGWWAVDMTWLVKL